MQLFSSNDKKKSSNNNATNQEYVEGRISGFKVAIVSTRESIIDGIKSILYLYNVLSIEVISLEIDDINENPRWSEFDIFIIDINNNQNAEEISAIINRYIPIKASTILVGNNDSISFADILSKKGIHFLLEKNQFERIPELLYSRSTSAENLSKRIGSVVTFLGCKGGIGTSSLIVHILKKITKSTQYPILYVQGASTSRNADFLLEKPIDKGGSVTDIDEMLKVKIEQDDEMGKYDYLDTSSFNISILDQNIGLYSCYKNLENIINLSNIIIFVVNRDPYSIKVAKNALDEINRIGQKNKLILNKRFLVCVNDNQPFDKKSSLQDADIEEYLGRQIDFTRKYIANSEKFKKSYTSNEISEISAAVIGVVKNSKNNNPRSIFGLLSKKSAKS